MAKKGSKLQGLAAQLPLALTSGEYKIGYSRSMTSLLKKAPQYIIMAMNTPYYHRESLKQYIASHKIKTNIISYEGTNNELAAMAGLKYRANIITILNQGDADLSQAKI